MVTQIDRQWLRAPFPWFGGKSQVADRIWDALGDVKGYVEPFAGSAVVLLSRPDWPERNVLETINDADGMVSNFWRATAANPAAVAEAADWPVNENDLTARNIWLAEHRADLTTRLEGNPGYFDARVAGWWAW